MMLRAFCTRFHVFVRRFTAAGAVAADWTWMGLFGAENIDVRRYT